MLLTELTISREDVSRLTKKFSSLNGTIKYREFVRMITPKKKKSEHDTSQIMVRYVNYFVGVSSILNL